MDHKLLTADQFVDQKMGCSYRYVYSETEFFRPHFHDYYEIFLVLAGEALHQVNGAELQLQRGSLVFIRPSDHHNYSCEKDQLFSMLNITFTAQTAQLLFDYLGKGFPSQTLLEEALPPEILLPEGEITRIEKRMNKIQAVDPCDDRSVQTEIRILLFDIFTHQFSDFEAATDQIPLWLEEMCADLRKNKNFAMGAEYFFSLSGKTREHISRCMKKYMKMTVSEYINTLRLNYIANMLHNSNHSITQIIYDSGFNNISWACELFKRKYSMTMREYRKRSHP